jgi:hypothetical protein
VLYFIIGNSLHIAITARSLKFISSVRRRQVAGADEVYVHVVKTKCMPILFYGIECLCVASGIARLSVVWNTAFR